MHEKDDDLKNPWLARPDSGAGVNVWRPRKFAGRSDVFKREARAWTLTPFHASFRNTVSTTTLLERTRRDWAIQWCRRSVLRNGGADTSARDCWLTMAAEGFAKPWVEVSCKTQFRDETKLTRSSLRRNSASVRCSMDRFRIASMASRSLGQRWSPNIPSRPPTRP